MTGKLVLVPFPFTDLTASKLRPALVLYECEEDVILAFISSKIPDRPSETDVIITSKNAGFKKTGLKVDSVIRLDKITTVLKELVLGEIGEIDAQLKKEVKEKMQKMFEKL
ncbi:MAG: type II toxin-antitoxin system PemK/MazF family toxin [bacterium]